MKPKKNLLNQHNQNQAIEGKDTDNYIKLVEDCIYNNPLPLLNIKNQYVIELIDSYLPYSHGMEFECSQQNNYDEELFKAIPNIMEVNVDSCEQRYRIPSGLKGMICLYNICNLMKDVSINNTESSTHYHTDLTDIWSEIDVSGYRKQKEGFDYITQSLIEWKTATDLSKVSHWWYFNDIGTLEVRIGEPTFDYNIIIKRLMQCSDLCKRIRNIVPDDYKLNQLQKQLQEMNFFDELSVINQNQEIINNKIIKW